MRCRHERLGCIPATSLGGCDRPAGAVKIIGVAAKAASGTVGEVVTLTGYTAGVAAFGEDVDPGMSTILRLLFLNGASTVAAVRVADEEPDYAGPLGSLVR